MRVLIKHQYKGNSRWAFMRWADIPTAEDPRFVYLRRLRILQTPWFALYLHFIYEPDKDRDPHDHPFNFRSLVLRGSYTEKVWRGVSHDKPRPYWPSGISTHRRGSIHSMPKDACHTITDISEPLVTLILAGRKNQKWGFYVDDEGWMPWEEFNRRKYSDMKTLPTGELQIDEFS